jgi:HD-GYP domain-containing protein (c-di-GMP phosphodiesterase class II)
MRLVRLPRVSEGMELARDIPSRALGSQPLLRRGVQLSAKMTARLSSVDVRAVWIEDDLGDGIVPTEPLPDDVRRATEQAVQSCLTAARSAAESLGILPSAAVSQIEQAAANIVQALAECPEAALALDDLASADSYTYSHSVRVATLGLLLGQRMIRLDGWTDYRGQLRHDRQDERLSQLAVGLLIHDIGKISIPAEILNKPGPLTPEEWELIKRHPAAGASMLSSELISPLAIAVVRDHHERWDGLGYPSGRADTEIHEFARIASVADAYDAITADRPYKAATAPYVGVRIVCEGAGTRFDAAVVEHFKRVAMPYPVGHTVALPDGTAGVVAAVDPANPEYPVIRYRNRDGELINAAMHLVDGEMQDDHESEPTVGSEPSPLPPVPPPAYI